MLNPRRLCLDLGERARDVAMRDAEIADIGEIHCLDLGPGCRMIAIDQHPARLADCRRPEACPGPVRGAEIEWYPGDAECRVGAHALDAEEAWPRSKSRDRGHGLLSGEATTGWKGRSHPLEDGGDALADADAHRHQRIAPAGALQLTRGGQRDARARGAERVTDGDGPAVHIDPAVVERQFEPA